MEDSGRLLFMLNADTIPSASRTPKDCRGALALACQLPGLASVEKVLFFSCPSHQSRMSQGNWGIHSPGGGLPLWGPDCLSHCYLPHPRPQAASALHISRPELTSQAWLTKFNRKQAANKRIPSSQKSQVLLIMPLLENLIQNSLEG